MAASGTLAALVPAPRRWDRGPTEVIGAAAIDVTGAAAPGAIRILSERLSQRRIDVAAGPGSWPVGLVLDAGRSGEAYRIDARRDGMTVTAGTVAGLCRGAATAGQLLIRRGPSGPTEVITGTVEDRPVVPLRMLAGWGLYRDHRLGDALRLATLGGYNRVLYNWWTAVPGERLPDHVGPLVVRARERGVELVCELRRQVLGPRFCLDDEVAVAELLRLYDDAVDRGFRAFGLLFDDTDLDAFEDEIGLLRTVVEHLTVRLGHEPEMWFCPRFYWFPGELDYSWLPRSIGPDGPGQVDLTPILGAAERRSPEASTARQERYQELLAAALPDRTLVYLANWWGGTPDDWADALATGWTDRLGAPAFWDNQLQNDYRLSNVVPAPLEGRPAAFAERLAAYALNAPVPLVANAPAAITAGAWAWNPHGYDPNETFDGALGDLVGADAAVPSSEALARWRDLVTGLVEPTAGGRYHIPGLRRAVAEGRSQEVREEMAAVTALLAEARTELPERVDALALDMLDELGREPNRLGLELQLAELTENRIRGKVSREDARAHAAHLLGALSSHLARRLPPSPDLDSLLHADELDLRHPGPGLSWFLHFHASAIQNGVAHLLAEIEAS